MPVYVYEVINDDGSGGEQFEVFQKMSDPALTEHPETNQPVRRIPTVPYVPTKYHPQSTKKMLSDKNLDRLGFTKYVKKDDGSGYEKRAGSGPDYLSRPPE